MSAIECPICNEQFSTGRKPKVAPCGHSICTGCTERIKENHCPVCRAAVRWRDAPDNYMLLSVIGTENPLEALARQEARERAMGLDEVKRKLEADLAKLETDKQRIQKERESAMRLPHKEFDIQEITRRTMLEIQREVEIVEVAQKTDVIIDGDEVAIIQQEFLSYQHIIEKFTIRQEQLMAAGPPRNFENEESKDPLEMSILRLADEINTRIRRRGIYISAVQEVVEQTEEVLSLRKAVIAKYERARAELEHRAASNDKEAAALRRNIEATTARIQQLYASIDNLKRELKAMELEEQEQLINLETDAQRQILELTAQMQVLEGVLRPVQDAWKRQRVETLSTLRSALSLSQSLLAKARTQLRQREKRVADLKALLENDPRHLSIERDIGMMQQKRPQMDESMQVAGKTLAESEGANQRADKELAGARMQLTQIETSRRNWVTKGLQTKNRIDKAQQRNSDIDTDLKMAQTASENSKFALAKVASETEDRKKKFESLNRLLNSASTYQETVLSPLLQKLEEEISEVELQTKAVEETFRTDMEVLEAEYNRLAVHNVSVTPFVTSPGFSPPSPPRGNGNYERRQLSAQRAENDRLDRECAALNQRLTLLAREAKNKQFDVSTVKPHAKSDLQWTFWVSLAAAFLFFSFVRL